MPLLLIGQPMDASGFGTLASHFPDRTVVTYDPRGLGRSTRRDGDLSNSPQQQAEDLHLLVGELGGTVDLFGSSGGAVTGLHLVATHPEDVRTFVAHEPPVLSVLPDAAQAFAAEQRVQEAYHRRGWGAGMAAFIALTSVQGEFTSDFGRELPDPSAFGLPTAGRRVPRRPAAVGRLQRDHGVPPGRRRADRRLDPGGRRGWRREPGHADVAHVGGAGRRARPRADGLPQQPRRLPRRRVRPAGSAGGVRRAAARGPRRRGRERPHGRLATAVRRLGQPALRAMCRAARSPKTAAGPMVEPGPG